MKAWLIGLALARALDATSSCQAFAHGAYEANPAIPTSCRAVVSVETGVAVAQIVSLHQLSQTHPRIAKTLAAITIGVEVPVALHNRGGVR